LATFAALLPSALALILLGAHFFRAGLFPLAAACVACCGLLFVRSPWSTRAVQAFLGLGVLEWLRSAWAFASARAAAGQPYGRLLLILGAVAAATLAGALLLRLPAARRHFRTGP
jgi:hypothetical protein